MPEIRKKLENSNQMSLEFDKLITEELPKRVSAQQTIGNVISWIGGKQKMADRIISMMPVHETYCEVFFGGGAIFWAKQKSKHNFINDINSNLTNLYLILQNKQEEFWHYAHKFIYSQELFDICIEKYGSEEWNTFSDVKKAVIFYFIVECSFNNDCKNFTANQEFSIWDKFGILRKTGEKLQGVVIQNLDFRKFLDKRLSQGVKNTLFYLDPPYVVASGKSYYEYLFSDYEHSDLARQCDEINEKGGMFILSYEDAQIVRDLYRNYEQKTIEFTYSLATAVKKEGVKKNELLISNFKMPHEQLTLGV